jgi:PAS domain S-box-containing protein
MPSTSITLLLIEDNAQDAQLFQEALAQHKHARFQLIRAVRLSEGLKRLAEGGIDLVLLDLLLPDSEGLDTLVKVHRQAPRIPVVVLTASDDEALAVAALQKGAQDYLVKGFIQVYPETLERSIRYAIERQHAETEVESAHAQTQQLLASISSILIGVSPTGTVTHWNTVAEDTFGQPASEMLNRPLAECQLRWDAVRILQGVAECGSSGRPARVDDVSFLRPDGREGFLGVTIIPMRGTPGGLSGYLLFGADVTERKQAEADRIRLQEQLLQAQKMETIGRFAGGIAHDFNNFLQVILGFAWLIRARYQHDPQLLGDLQEIVHSAESASGMVRQLLAFARRQPLQLKPLDVHATIHNMERLLQQLVGERVRLALQLTPKPLIVNMDPTGLEQILMNLSANARDSMQQGGTLTIRTQAVSIDGRFLEERPWWTKPGEYVHLSIQDTGVGMDPSVAAHIFEPFFTTKQLGKGTGLGLAVVYGLVKQHEGMIDIETAVGQGTTFHLYFPRAPLPVQATPQPVLSTDAPKAGTNGPATAAKKRVLVVDDNPPIRLLCERILESAYEVTTVPSARAALEELGHKPYDLVLTDLRMPNMDGVSLIQEVARQHPGLRVVAMTGSLTTELEQRLLGVSLSGDILRKPFTAPMLLDTVDRCLEAP